MNVENLVLRPNCLLTRAPLVFLSGPRSLFSPQKLAAGLQTYLAAHGYVIATLFLPFRNSTLRRHVLNTWMIEQSGRPFHFIMAAPTWFELERPLTAKVHSDTTFTLITDTVESLSGPLRAPPFDTFVVSPESKIPLRYRWHALFLRAFGTKALPYATTLLTELPVEKKSVYDRFLDHCIELAENEL